MTGKGRFFREYNKRYNQIKKREAQMKLRLKMQREHYKVLAEQLDKMSAMHHDFRHHIRQLMIYLSEEKLEEMKRYLTGLSESTQMQTAIHFCRDYDLDVLIRYYYSRAEEKHITFDVHVKLTRKLKIPAEDLCVIFGNLLENALEASLYLPEGERMIRLFITEQSDSFAVMIKNRFDGVIKEKGVLYQSRKKEKRTGVGIASVKTTVEKYGGELWTIVENDGRKSWFTAQVLMVNEK